MQVQVSESVFSEIKRLDANLPTPADTLEEWLDIEEAETPEEQAKLIFQYLVDCQKVMAHIVQSANDELTENDYR